MSAEGEVETLAWPRPEAEVKVEAVLRRLQIQTGKEGRVPDFAREIALYSSLGMRAELPLSRPASPARSGKELEQLAKLCVRLRDHIRTMHAPACETYNALAGDDLINLEQHLNSAILWAQKARGSLDVGTTVAAKTVTKPKNVRAAFVTEVARRAFQDLTGRRPTHTVYPYAEKTGGAFLVFLKDVFVALGIKASAEVCAKREARRHKTRDISRD